MTGSPPDPTISLREITDENREAVAALRVAPGQEQFVAGVADSFKDAADSPEDNPWYRAIYANDEPVGFVMLGWNVAPRPGILSRWFLWRLLVDARFQHRGYGREALGQIIELIRAEGATELLSSYEPGDGSPWPFYEKLGFVETGEVDEDERVIRLVL